MLFFIPSCRHDFFLLSYSFWGIIFGQAGNIEGNRVITLTANIFITSGGVKDNHSNSNAKTMENEGNS